MATMFAKMMYEMKNRNHNNYNTYSSNSHHGDSKMDKMRMMMKMMKMSNMMDDYPSSSYSSDDSAFDMFSELFKNKYEHLLDICYEMATNLPADIADNSVVTGDTFGTVKLGEVKMFTKCCEKAKTKLCMHQDIKNKVESNFGPMEDILQETQLTEHEFFPLVMQLLHGKEMD